MADPLDIVREYAPNVPGPASWSDMSPFQAMVHGAHTFMKTRAEADAKTMKDRFRKATEGLDPSSRDFAEQVRMAHEEAGGPVGMWNNPYARSIFRTSMSPDVYVEEQRELAGPGIMRQSASAAMKELTDLSSADPDWMAKAPQVVAKHLPVDRNLWPQYNAYMESSVKGFSETLATKRSDAAYQKVKQWLRDQDPRSLTFQNDLQMFVADLRSKMDPLTAQMFDGQMDLLAEATGGTDYQEHRAYHENVVKPKMKELEKLADSGKMSLREFGAKAAQELVALKAGAPNALSRGYLDQDFQNHLQSLRSKADAKLQEPTLTEVVGTSRKLSGDLGTKSEHTVPSTEEIVAAKTADDNAASVKAQNDRVPRLSREQMNQYLSGDGTAHDLAKILFPDKFGDEEKIPNPLYAAAQRTLESPASTPQQKAAARSQMAKHGEFLSKAKPLDFSREDQLGTAIAPHPYEQLGMLPPTTPIVTDQNELIDYYRKNGTTEGYPGPTQPTGTVSVSPDGEVAINEPTVEAAPTGAKGTKLTASTLQGMDAVDRAIETQADIGHEPTQNALEAYPSSTAHLLQALGTDRLPTHLFKQGVLRDAMSRYESYTQAMEEWQATHGNVRKVAHPVWVEGMKVLGDYFATESEKQTARLRMETSGQWLYPPSPKDFGMPKPETVDKSLKTLLKDNENAVNRFDVLLELESAMGPLIAGMEDGQFDEHDSPGVRKFLSVVQGSLSTLINMREQGMMGGGGKYMLDLAQSIQHLNLWERNVQNLYSYFTGEDTLGKLRGELGWISLMRNNSGNIVEDKMTSGLPSLLTPGTDPVQNGELTRVLHNIMSAPPVGSRAPSASSDPDLHLLQGDNNVVDIGSEVFSP